jgi:hypothetical protein
VETVTNLAAPTMFGLTSFFRPTPPSVSVRATTDAWLLNIDQAAHDLLRRVDLRAAEQLAVAAVRVLAEHFELLDRRISDYLAEHPDDHPKVTEWSDFRARLFEESNRLTDGAMRGAWRLRPPPGSRATGRGALPSGGAGGRRR